MFNRLKTIVLTYHRLLFYSCWLLLHIVQAGSTELFDDEAYYWVYAKFPAWGYFDHPPMIAYLIKSGYFLFENELGVRLLPILLTTVSLFLIEELIQKKNAFLFYAICASLAIAQIGGMMAVPDTPLMFFVALFFYLYRKFLGNMSPLNTFLLGLGMALMLYTKYHAVLIIMFTGISNPALFKKQQTYLAALVALLLFLPHIYWQVLHNYPSLQFHLFERNSSAYEFNHTIEYIVGQILMAGPLMGWLLIIAACFYKPVSLTERALKFTFIGIYVFFLISTLKGKAEANWTIPSFIGLIVLSHQYLLNYPRWQTLLFRSIPFSLMLVFAGRAIMMIDLPPAWWVFKDEFHGNTSLVKAVRSNAGNLPIVFLDSYQKPSKYWFYSGDTSFTLNTPNYRRNNFNFWNIEDHLIGKPAYVVGQRDSLIFTEPLTSVRLEKNGGTSVPLYYSFSRIMISSIQTTWIDSASVSLRFTTSTPEQYLDYFQQPPYDTARVYLAIYRDKKVMKYLPVGMLLKDVVKTNQTNLVTITSPLAAGTYQAKFAISSCIPGHPSLNSPGFVLRK